MKTPDTPRAPGATAKSVVARTRLARVVSVVVVLARLDERHAQLDVDAKIIERKVTK